MRSRQDGFGASLSAMQFRGTYSFREMPTLSGTVAADAVVSLPRLPLGDVLSARRIVLA
ncbi:MAG: hypothetical protein M1499_00300 [Firmicutes bacterium]|nr:hypothetical protein [Bacillota bacterium]